MYVIFYILLFQLVDICKEYSLEILENKSLRNK